MAHAYLASTIKTFGIKENKMASLKDVVKAALEKKQAEQAQVKTDNKVDTGKGPGVHSQVVSNKPTKKSAGRGR
jgi:hypothetical protein